MDYSSIAITILLDILAERPNLKKLRPKMLKVARAIVRAYGNDADFMRELAKEGKDVQ